MRGLSLLVAIAAVFLCAAAPPSAVSLGKAGLTALNATNYKEAVRLFTLALRARDLKASDRELAYLKRGEAELDFGEVEAGKLDLEQALKLQADDAEAKQFLALVQGASPGATSNVDQAMARRTVREQRFQVLWSSMGQLAGHTWLQVDGKPALFARYRWERPWEILTYTGTDRNGRAFVGRYEADKTASQINGVSVSKGGMTQSVVHATPTGFVEDTGNGTTAVRQTYQPLGTESFQLTTDTLRNGRWTQGKPTQFVPVSQDFVPTLGWKSTASPDDFARMSDAAKCAFTGADLTFCLSRH